ncbi:MAG: hypothetical protein AAF493_26955 [Pseudomonadota bacterium]
MSKGSEGEARRFSVDLLDDDVVVVRFLPGATDRDCTIAINLVQKSYPGHPRLWNLENLSPDVSADDVMENARNVASTVFEPARVAVAASEPLLFGLARMYQAYLENATSNIEMETFYDEEDALRWLRT